MWGHGRAFKFEFVAIVGGIVVLASFEAKSVEDDPPDGADDGCDDEIGLRCRGESFVALRLT